MILGGYRVGFYWWNPALIIEILLVLDVSKLGPSSQEVYLDGCLSKDQTVKALINRDGEVDQAL